jgi:hypothetical protein
MRSALETLAPAYPGVERPATRLDPGALSASAARLKFSLQDLR